MIDVDGEASLQLPAPPGTGIVTDAAGIEWRRDSVGMWTAGPCPTCEVTPGGVLSWPALLERGPLTPVEAA